jgi:uncharacterized protein YecE (DUF72 family)
MSVKVHHGLTHYRRLRSPEPWVERFERCWTALGERREALLVQVHPELERDDARLDHFLACMPTWIPVAMELRHPSWDDPAVYTILHRHDAAYVVMSGAKVATIPCATADLVYVRMHGPAQDSMYHGSYPDDELRVWADRIMKWEAEDRRVLVYFNNDLGGHAIRNARKLKELLTSRG